MPPRAEKPVYATMVHIQDIDHVAFRVRDPDRMVRFYTDVLGAVFAQYQEGPGLYQLRVAPR